MTPTQLQAGQALMAKIEREQVCLKRLCLGAADVNAISEAHEWLHENRNHPVTMALIETVARFKHERIAALLKEMEEL